MDNLTWKCEICGEERPNTTKENGGNFGLNK